MTLANHSLITYVSTTLVMTINLLLDKHTPKQSSVTQAINTIF